MRTSSRIVALGFAAALATLALAGPAAATVAPAGCSNANVIGNVINAKVPILSNPSQAGCNVG
ncbi:hypothetical protein [Spongiactinospora sp. TRM90649]|uniref:hypothetical protein n=1 Tax=Spongiactinospora sp. TRM90649 TaxID=3031114 RepID=UPI0023F6C596|nr:hypothetical protein [Spongiactinospora sp. TRM90649]MDF5755358.1 hypothetical protein [Spongiactinospora sp. TRM90649]